MTFKEIPLERIRAAKNVRSEPETELSDLMRSIERYDVIQPVLVVPRDGDYELVAGHRRLAAMKARNERTIPAIVRDDLEERDLPFVKLVENTQRKELSPAELVEAFDAMRKDNPRLTNGAIARMLGRSSTWVSIQYKVARTYEELKAAGVAEQALKALSKTELEHLARIRDPEERAQTLLRNPKGSRGRGAYIVNKRGSYRDSNGGFAIMEAPGGAATTTLKIVCESAAVRYEVLKTLYRLKARLMDRDLREER